MARALALLLVIVWQAGTAGAQTATAPRTIEFDPVRGFAIWQQRVAEERAEAQRRRNERNTDWFARNGFSAATSSRLVEPWFLTRKPLIGLVLTESSTFSKKHATFYQMGNQPQFELTLGSAQLRYQGAVVRMFERRCEPSDACPASNWIHAYSGWATDVAHHSGEISDEPDRVRPIYSNIWLKGRLTREAVHLRSGVPTSTGCGKKNAFYAYRYEYHAPDGRTIQFYQRPVEVSLTSSWTTPVTCGSLPVIPPEPDYYWAAESNASLDTSNKCLPVIRWADGTTEEFHGAATLPGPDPAADGSAPPYVPSCSASDLMRDLRRIDANGNIETFRFSENTETLTDSHGRQTVLTFDVDDQQFRRLRTVDLPSVGSAPPHRYTVHWRAPLEVDFNLLWSDVVCRSHLDGTVQNCSSVDGQPAPNRIQLVDSITVPDGRSYSFEYGPWGNLTKVTDPGGAVKEYSYGDRNNLDFGRAAAPLLDRVVGRTWSGESVKMHARGVVHEIHRPDGPSGPGYCTRYAVVHRKLDPTLFPSCTYNIVGAGVEGPPACSQVWQEVTTNALEMINGECDMTARPAQVVRKTGLAAHAYPVLSTESSSTEAIPHGWLIGEETWSGSTLLAASYKGDPNTGELWYAYDRTGASSKFAIPANIRTLKLKNVRDGLMTTTNFLYDSTIDINPDPAAVVIRNTGLQTSTCTFAGNVAEFGCSPAGATPLIREDAEFLNYFSGTFAGPHYLGLSAADRMFGPNAEGTGFDTTPLAATTKRYDESPVTRSGRPASVLDPGISREAGAPRGNLTTATYRVSATKSVSTKVQYFDNGIFEWNEDHKGQRTRHLPDFSLCTSAAVLTSSVVNAKGHVETKADDCQSGLPLMVSDGNGSTYTQYDYLGRVVEIASAGDELTDLSASGPQPYTRHPAAATGAGSKPGDARVSAWTEYLDLGVIGRQRTVSHVRDGSPGGLYTKVFSDGLGRSVQTRAKTDTQTTGFGEVVSSTAYDGLGQVVSEFRPCFAAASNSRTAHCGTSAVTKVYDGLGRETRVTAPGNRVTTHAYSNENGRWLRTTVDPRRFTSKTYTNLLGQEVEIRRQSSLCGGFCSTKSAFDGIGRLLSVSDPKGNTVRFTYDDLSRQLTMDDPNMGRWSYEYDDNGNLTSRTDGKGQTIKFAYDVLNRLTRKDVPPEGPSAEDVTYFYDGEGPASPSDSPLPTLLNLDPPVREVGSGRFTLIVTGSNFAAGAKVTFNGRDQVTTVISPNRVAAEIPAEAISSAGAYAVSVVNPPPGGGASAPWTFTVTNSAPPVVHSVAPTKIAAGSPGFTLALDGSNFAPGVVVTFDGQNRPTTFVSELRITAAIPASDVAAVGTHSIAVVNPILGRSSAVFEFAVVSPGPVIIALDPPSAPTNSGGVTLAVHGQEFSAGDVVTFNGQNRETIYRGSSELWAILLASDLQSAGEYPVTVVNSGSGRASAAATFSVINAVPPITSISPSNAGQGGAAFTLAVSGHYFVSGSVVTFNGQSRPTTFVNAQQLTAAIPATDLATPGTHSVAVVSPAPGGGTSASLPFTVSNAVPAIHSIAPAAALKGSSAFTLTVSGSNFVSGAVVTFNGQSRATTFVSAQRVTANILATDVQTAGSYSVTVVNPAGSGGASAPATFTVNNPAPVLTAVGPASMVKGSAAFTLTVNGSNFVSGSVISFNGQSRQTTFVSAQQLTAAILASDLQAVGTYQIRANNPTPGGGASGSISFAVTSPAPSISSISPGAVVRGSSAFTLTVNGTDFVSGAVVTFNGQSRSTTFINAQQVSAAIPATDVQTAGNYPVAVVNPAGSGGASAARTFTVNNPVPVVTSFAPSNVVKGSAAFTLTINGNNFVVGAAVTFNGQARQTAFVNAQQLTAAVPATDVQNAGAYPVTVVNPGPGGGASAAVSFTVTNAPPIVSLTAPASGHGFGSPATITISATASGAAGIAKVEFFRDGVLLGTDTTAPYSTLWTGVGPGTYVLSAKATDGAGLSAQSSAVSITVFASDQLANFARGRAASQSSEYPQPGAQAGLAVNGILEDVTSTDYRDKQWWQVDLGATRQITEIRIWNRADCCQNRLSDFHVFVSDSPFTSSDPAATAAQPGVFVDYVSGAAPLKSIRSVNRTGRYVRIQLTGTNWLSLGEVEVMGPPVVPVVRDAGFETPALYPKTWSARPTGTAWTFINSAGLASNKSTFVYQNPDAPEGGQVAYIQGESSLSQTVSGFISGVPVVVRLRGAQRVGGNTSPQELRISIDGMVVGTFQPPSGNYTDFTSSPFLVAPGAHTLKIAGRAGPGDYTAFVDFVRFDTVEGVPTKVLDSGFETPALYPQTWSARPAGTAWTFVNSAGLASNKSTFVYQNPDAPEGAQVAYIQGESSLSQTVTGFLSGVPAVVRLKGAQRVGGNSSPQELRISIGGVVVGVFQPPSGNYTDFTSSPFVVPPGAHTLKITGRAGPGDYTALVDSVRVEEVETRIVPVGVSASRTNQPPQNAMDGDPATSWNAGAFPPQYIQFDLGGSYTLKRIRLHVVQSPAGTAKHEIWGGLSADVATQKKLGTLEGHFTEGQWLELAASVNDIRYLRVSTVGSPSWVGWAEIEIYCDPAAQHLKARAASASRSDSSSSPLLAVDGNPDTWWNSGAFPVQSITLDLGSVSALTKLRLKTVQNPDGATTHVISAANVPSQFVDVGTISKVTTHGEWLELPNLAKAARYIKVTTTRSPSWVGWLEIEAYGQSVPGAQP